MWEPTPQMYSDEGDDAVNRALETIEQMAQYDLTIRNKTTLNDAARPILQAVGNLYPELWDTEPRGYVNDRLDQICKMNGWAYNEWEGYDW